MVASGVHIALHCLASRHRIAADRPSPLPSVLRREIVWSVCSSCSIVTLIDMLLDSMDQSSGMAEGGLLESGWGKLMFTLLFLVLWGDTHFYWTHRLLHAVPFLYRRVHSVHHQSRNPNAFSGLCFHPIESLVYFSQLGIFALCPGLCAWRTLFKWGTILMPVTTHHGFDDSFLGGHSTFHHAHHVRVVGNFGGLHPLWDRVAGTLLPEGK